jgi:hypothetical protein
VCFVSSVSSSVLLFPWLAVSHQIGTRRIMNILRWFRVKFKEDYLTVL